MNAFRRTPFRCLQAALAAALCAALAASPARASNTPKPQEPPPGSVPPKQPPATPDKAGARGGGGDTAGAKPQAAMVIEDGPVANEGPPPPPGGEEKLAIGEYIKSQSRDVVRCYEKRLDDRPTLNGKLKVRFDIGASGRVIGATAEGFSDPTLISCVVQIVRKWEFDKPRSGGKLRVVYPFLFQPVGR